LSLAQGSTSACGRQFFNFNLFNLFLKLTPGKHYLHPVTPLVAPGAVARQATFVAPHAAARQGCHGGQPRPAGQTWARTCRTGACGAAAATIQGSCGPLSSSSSLSSSARARLHQAVTPPPPAGTPPNPAICGGASVGNRPPYPWEGIALI
jgi:hypothetical protein